MPQFTIQQACDLAVQHHRAGRLQEAETIYREILARQPERADATHLLGLIAHQVGRNDVAADLIRKAIALKHDYAEAYYNLGNVLRADGQSEGAIAAFRQAILLDPKSLEARNNLGKALKDNGELDESIVVYRQVIALKPDHGEGHYNLGNVLRSKGQLCEAVAAFRQAIALDPHFAEAHSNLGNALMANGRLAEAIAAFRQAIIAKPAFVEAHINLGDALRVGGQLDASLAACRQAIVLNANSAVAHGNLGNTLYDMGRLDEAIATYRQAIARRPNYAQAHSNLANPLRAKGQIQQAVDACLRAIALQPGLASAHCNLGAALQEMGRLEEAIAAFRQAVLLNPDFPEAHYNLGAALLSQGDFGPGWEEYEWRWKRSDCPSAAGNYPHPRWDGSDLMNRTILLHAEQGLGDTIQFIRYVPLVCERGGKVILCGDPQLRQLLRGMPGVEKWLEPGAAIPHFDVHCPLLSLPLAFGTTLETIPAKGPYLSADTKLVESWCNKLATYASMFKVALVWAGKPTHPNDGNRSMKLADLAGLMRVPGAGFFSLQKGEAAEQARSLPQGTELVDWTAELNDFTDTAALIDNLDLVISVDTAVPHLAGAMGKPVWLLLPFAPDWRWMEAREGKTEGGRRKAEEGRGGMIEGSPFGLPPSAFRLSSSPWYPTMRLFRQPARGDWESVVAEVANALSLRMESRSHDAAASGGA
jgi:tetratricopeptide (TPR) repeat protein